MDVDHRLPKAPPYFNLGFVIMNKPALDIFQREIFTFETRFKELIDSHMRCQIACTIIAFRHSMEVRLLPGTYNAANDNLHYLHNRLSPAELRVLHYLRSDEIDRNKVFLPEYFSGFLNADLRNPINIELQRLARLIAPDFTRPMTEAEHSAAALDP